MTYLDEQRSWCANPSICLEHGADECALDERMEICARGMSFHTRWQWSPGTQLAVAFSFLDENGALGKMRTDGIVVDCERVAAQCYRTTLLFLDVPEELRAHLENCAPQTTDRGMLPRSFRAN